LIAEEGHNFEGEADEISEIRGTQMLERCALFRATKRGLIAWPTTWLNPSTEGAKGELLKKQE
jgi:hypothetical protein